MVMKNRTVEPEGFAEFWALWLPFSRKNDGRGDARDTYRKHVLRGAEPRDIIDGASWYLRSLSARDKEYIPMASTWLNRCAYEDFGPKEREFQARLAQRVEAAAPIIEPKSGQTAFLRKFEAMKAGEGTVQ